MWQGVQRVCPVPREIIGMCTPGAISTVGTAAAADTKTACITRMTATGGTLLEYASFWRRANEARTKVQRAADATHTFWANSCF